MMKHPALRIALFAALAGSSANALAQGYTLEGAVIDSRTSRSLGVINERGNIDSLFRAQKAMTFGILRSAGISLDQLSPEVRARIERFQTTNLDAFRAFSQGLDLKDQGKFVEAKEFFRRAAELDPAFALAAEQQRSMPDLNLGSGVQTRAVLAAAAGVAVDRGKASITVDAAHALAALAAGLQVAVASAPANVQAQSAADAYTTNPAGSGGQFLPNLVAGLAFAFASGNTSTVSLSDTTEWKPENYRLSNGVLESVGAEGNFQLQRQGSTNVNAGSAVLADGSSAYWGSWLPAATNGATITLKNASGATVTLPAVGPVDYVYGQATRVLPTTGSVVFDPVANAGSLKGITGTIKVDFVNRGVALQNLGFAIGGLNFAGLNGTADISKTIASGTFNGSYTSGTCGGCTGFAPLSSNFGGSFIGKNADGLVFSTFLQTGDGGTASGVNLFKKPGPN